MKHFRGFGSGVLFSVLSSPISTILLAIVDRLTKSYPFEAFSFLVTYLNMLVVVLIVTLAVTGAILVPCAYVLSRTGLLSPRHLMIVGLVVGLSLAYFRVFGPMLDVFLIVFAAAGAIAGFFFGFGIERRRNRSA